MTNPTELIKSAEIAGMKGKPKAHLLNPEAVRVGKSLGSITGLTDLGVQLMTVMPGREYAEYHRHLYEEQCFYILSGRGEATIDEKPYGIEAGDFLGFRKNGAAHTIMNIGNEPLVFLCARVNLEQDVCDYPRKRKRLYISGAEEALIDFDNIRIEPLG